MRKLVCAAVTLVLVAGAGLAEEAKGAKKGAMGTLVKCDGEKGIICILVKKSKDDEGTKTEFKITDETKFQVGAGKGKEPTVLTDKAEIKEKLKEGVRVRLALDEEGKTVKTVTIMAAQRKKDQ
jgi:hypothetical protein